LDKYLGVVVLLLLKKELATILPGVLFLSVPVNNPSIEQSELGMY
jgi:hypothetical protein